MKRSIGTAIALLAAAGLAACSETSPPAPPDPVTVQLKWNHQAQFAGFYVALEKGYYGMEHLDVRFLEGGQGIDSTRALLDGQADFAVLSPEDVLIRRSQGRPLIAIAAIYRRSAVVFLSRHESGIVRPSDFPGKTIAAKGQAGAVRDFELQFHALMKRLGLGPASIRLVPYEPDYAGFLAGKVDVTPAYLTGGVIKLRQKGLKPNVIWPGDYGINFYSDILVTTESVAEDKSEQVTRFLRATLRGWQDAVGDPQAAVTSVMKYARIKDEALQTAMMDAMLPLVHTGEDQVGWMKPADWQEMHRIMVDQQILPASLADLDRTYTLRFLQSVYGTAK